MQRVRDWYQEAATTRFYPYRLFAALSIARTSVVFTDYVTWPLMQNYWGTRWRYPYLAGLPLNILAMVFIENRITDYSSMRAYREERIGHGPNIHRIGNLVAPLLVAHRLLVQPLTRPTVRAVMGRIPSVLFWGTGLSLACERHYQAHYMNTQ